MSRTLFEIGQGSDRALSSGLKSYLDDQYPAHDEPAHDDTLERLTECAQRCQDWLLAMRLSAELGQTDKAWQALEELEAEAAQMLEDHP